LKKRTRRLLAAVALALAAAPSLVIFAPDAASAPCVGSVDEARRHMERGFALYDKKQFLESAAEFDAAYRAQPFSAFLCNAAMAYQEALDFPNAISRYEAFLAAEPNPPDLARIKTMLAWLKAQNAAQIAARADGGAALEDAPATPPPPVQMTRSFRSQVVVRSEPSEAPLTVWARKSGEAPFVPGQANPGWEKVVSGVKTPHDLSLGAGVYHIVIDAFKDYKRSETTLELLPGRVYEFKANLSQGEFMGFLRVLSAASGARVHLDDPPPHKKPPWGRAPHGALVETGEHTVWVEAPGYEPASAKVKIQHGETVELSPALARVSYGYLRIDGNAEEVTVRVDGEKRGVYTPVGEALRLRIPAGKHRVELEASGRKTYAGEIDVPAGQELGVHGRLSYKPARATAVATGALTVGAIVGGIALFKQAGTPQAMEMGTASNAAAPTSAPTYYRVGGVISFGLGGLLGASTVYSLVSDPTPPSRVSLDKPKDLGDEDLAPPDAPLDTPRGRVFGTQAAAPARSCGAL
jgi:hypothetical protein